ncbi:T9SS type A sorting domain-containing protein [Flavobacterium sp. UBA7682]|uniref:T9SS type A sorting domain-containing protein n=1 Tax=Flavobacterium sp. UBA7682 TaxID=1946560 RepID=UPI0025B8C0E5|nr:T9SS type A sorting domain-containing protein [Flavobacterium sp. UBA7682]
MKLKLLFYYLLFSIIGLQAQTKSTDTVNLLTGMTAKLDLNNTDLTATLTLTGPTDRWFALQIGSFANGQGMESGQDVVYYNGSTLIDAVHNGIGIAPTQDANDWTMLSNTVNGGTRTIIATRAFNTGNPNDYDFVYANPDIDFAFSRMSTASYTLAYHGANNKGYLLNVPFAFLGTDEIEQPKETTIISPNPVDNSFTITSNVGIRMVKIYDMYGKLVTTHYNPIGQVAVSDLSKGIYFIEITSIENLVSIKKVIKE